MIRGILMYMERIYIPSNHKTPVHQLGLNLWKDVVIHSSKTKDRFLDTLLEHVLRERHGGKINRELIRNLIKKLMDLGVAVYRENFENRFLEDSRLESQKLIRSCECGDYLKKAESHLNEEIKRAIYLFPATKSMITDIVEKEMIETHLHTLVEMDPGLVNMLLDDKQEDLQRMYNLFRRVPAGLTIVEEVMTSLIRKTGKQLIMDPAKDPADFVQQLLDLKDKYDKIITMAFNNDKTFQKGLESSFEHFINLNNRFPEYMSLFVDGRLRRASKEVGDDKLEIVLDKLMMFVRFLQGKDVLQKYCENHMAKRLLSGKTISDDAEAIWSDKLKKECGDMFTYKMELMVKDMKTSGDTLRNFYEHHGPDLGDGPKLSVQVLTTGSRPIQPSPQCNLPTEILSVCDKFHAHYLCTHSERILSWQTNMGTAVLKATFSEGQEHEMNVSTFQMCVLMLFNNADRLTCKEIEQATAIPMSDLKRCLHSLACVKGKNVLRKEPMSKDIAEDDAFLFNDKFKSKFFMVKIGTSVVKQRESERQSLETQQRVEENRRSQIEAAIVRIMKSRRTLEHDNLLAEVTKLLQSQFLPKTLDIKKRIESLIDRTYLERDGEDFKVYRYLP